MLHYTGLPGYAAARARLTGTEKEVSAHWLVDEQGRAEALVAEARRAWHAGAGGWGASRDVNSWSIGIELQNPGDRPFAHAQIEGLARLLGEVMDRWAIPPKGVIAHSDLAPARKSDPGARFDWRKLAACGLSVWPDEAGDPGDPEAPLAPSLRAFGYPEAAPDLLLAAFRLRFRPWARGPEMALDRALADGLARRFPVDESISDP